MDTQKRGFTLIELLVVIAIISILAAILFPVFGRARENARRSSCQSNLKQVALGMGQYGQDYDERFVSWRAGNTGWAELIQPYLKSTQIFQCPSEINPPGPPSFSAAGYNDYVYNLQMGIAQGSDVFSGGAYHSVLTQSSLTVMLVDWNSASTEQWTEGCNTGGFISADGGAFGGGCSTGLADFSPGYFSGAGAAQRHLDGHNAAFADGHVKWYKGINGNQSSAIYSAGTPGSTSGSNPTFNVAP